MKSKPTSNTLESSTLKLQKNKKSKKSKTAKTLNAGVNAMMKNGSHSANSPRNGTKRNPEGENCGGLKSPSNGGCVNGISPFSGPAKPKKKIKRGKPGANTPVGSVTGVNSSDDSSTRGRNPGIRTTLSSTVSSPKGNEMNSAGPKKKKKRRKSGSISPADVGDRSSVNGGSNKTNETVNDEDSLKKAKKRRPKKKRRIVECAEVQNSAVAPESSGPNQTNKIKGKPTGESPNLTPAVKVERGVFDDKKSNSHVKQKREKYKNSKNSSLREKMLSRLSAARFRFINEELYKWDGQDPSQVFASDPKSFKAYHSGFRQQTKLWPINPIDVIIKSIKKDRDFDKKVIADFGCGEAKLALELSSNKVYSFDLVAINDRVTMCDNGSTNLYSGSVDVAVHCLSLMSSNISGYIKEANRVLKVGGLLKIAEVESRFEDVDKFVEEVCKFNFKLLKKDFSHNLFYFMDFEKVADIGVARKRKLPVLSLQPCLYKKR